MKLKKSLLLAFALFYFTGSFAQHKDVYFLKFPDKQVSTRDSADFIRVISDPDSGSVFFNVFELYANGNPKLRGKTFTLRHIVLEGQFIKYYPTGKKQQVGNYEREKLDGDVFDYYPNGNLYTHKQYHWTGDSLIIACNDSTGKPLVVDSNGYYIGYSKDFKTVYEEGNVKSGVKDGRWKSGADDKDVRVYANGKVISIGGRAIDPDDKAWSFPASEPHFKGGVEALYIYLTHHIKYPEVAINENVQGTFTISFIVEKDGSLSNLKIGRNLNNDSDGVVKIDNEVLRVFQESPAWIPGKQNGRVVRAAFGVPVTFLLHQTQRNTGCCNIFP
jgi:hypothetical protein